jgi:predicted N-formylglutamate amidohydrolase
MSAQNHPLLRASDPAPVCGFRESGRSDVLLLGDHAGNAMPAILGDMGLSSGDRTRHIAWDVGIRDLGIEVANALDATFLWQPYSRLVIDCNRDPWSAAAIPEVSDGTQIPGNASLDEPARDLRRESIHAPYHRRIAAELEARRARGVRSLIVSLHSFTPVMAMQRRRWHIGILHDEGDTSLSLAMLSRLRAETSLVIGDNEPYRMDGTDHTIPRHAYPTDLPYVEVEFRQDLLGDEQGVRQWAGRFVGWLRDAMATL